MKTKFNGILTLLLALVVQISFAQDRTISGTVSDESGPLPGVTVLKKGTTQGTETDFDGNYSIKAKTGDILVFSFVGMKSSEKIIGASNQINVRLESDNLLEEIVVIGYGQVSQRDLTTNVAVVEPNDVKSISTANLGTALQGTASGVQISQASGAPGGEVRIRVRGASSITGSNNPLFVIDGVPMFSGATISNSFGGQQNSALSNLNPDDIESIQILKDAASAAIYGDRGSNGVVIITTKQGKQGKAKFNISTSVGFQNPVNRYKTANYGQWLKFGDAYYENSGFPSGFWSTVWDGRQDFRGLPQDQLDTFYNSVVDQGDNYLDELLQDNAAVYNTNFNVSGGNEQTQYYLGLSHFKQEGVILNQDFDRRNVRLNLTQKLTDNLKFTGGISLTDENMQLVQSDNNIYGAFSTAILEAPGNSIRNADGSFDSSSYVFSNPIQNATEDLNLAYSFRILANADFQYNISDDLFLNTQYGLDQLNFRERQFNPPTSSQGSPAGYAREDKDTYRRIKVLQSISYNPQINDDIKLRAYLAGEWEKNITNTLSADATGFTTGDIPFLSPATTPTTTNSAVTEEKRVSVISRLGATFWNKLIVEFSVRADASTKFNEENRWGFFPAASVGYVISDEDWFKNDAVSYFKLRGSWGLTGNTTAVGRYTSQPAVGSGAYNAIGTSLLTQANPDIQWEETAQYDAGFQAKFLNNRITLDYAYFNKETDSNSLILPVPNAGIQGGAAISANVGSMVNTGHEVELSGDIFRSDSDGFNWNTNINLSTLDNKITSLGGTSPYGTGFVSRVEAGYALGAFRVLVADGLYQNDADVPASILAQNGNVGAGDVKYVDQNGDGIINDDDFVVAGKPFADYTINWKNDMSYKNFDLSFLWAMSEGNDVWNATRRFSGASSNRLFNKFTSELNYWTPTNTNTDLPRPNLNTQGYNNQTSTRFLEDGSFIKLRNVTFGYTLPKIKGFDKVRVYVAGDNLVLITDYSGIDPEVNFNGSQNVTGGTDFLTQGGNKVFKFGVNVSF